MTRWLELAMAAFLGTIAISLLVFSVLVCIFAARDDILQIQSAISTVVTLSMSIALVFATVTWRIVFRAPEAVELMSVAGWRSLAWFLIATALASGVLLHWSAAIPPLTIGALCFLKEPKISELVTSWDVVKRPAGYFKLVEVRGVPLFLHWSFPLGGLLISAWAGFDRYEATYYTAAYLCLILIHELGHLAVARAAGLKVFALYLSGVGGECLIQPPNTTGQAFRVYAAGLMAQLIVFVLAVLYVAFAGIPNSVLAKCVVNTFIFVNAIMFFSNLIPYVSKDGRANDGHVLWNLVRHLLGKAPFPIPASPAASRVFPEGTRLLDIKDLVPKNFAVGVEILNDNATPMQLVVAMLVAHLGMKQEEAIALMIAIHSKGGALISLPTIEKAEQIAKAISEDARRHGYNLICSAVDAQQSHATPLTGRGLSSDVKS
jgi:ATP-dependent Clp protease adapter protein ClpS/Zn-dependent protease